MNDNTAGRVTGARRYRIVGDYSKIMVIKPSAFNYPVQSGEADADEEVDATGYLNDWKYKLLLTLTPPALRNRITNTVQRVLTWEDYD